MKKIVARYIWNILIAFDQLCNSLLAGDPGETISCRMGKSIRDGRCKFCRPLCWMLHKLDSNHCAESINRTGEKTEINRI